MKVMSVPNHPIFRNNAVKHYMQSREKSTLPRFINLPIALFLWILLALLLVSAALAWYKEIPVYLTAPGIVLNESHQQSQKTAEAAVAAAAAVATVAIFLPQNQGNKVNIGSYVRMQLDNTGVVLKGRVTDIKPTMSPYALLQRYGLDGRYALLITKPSMVVFVQLKTISSTMYAGSMVTADVEVGSQRIISLLPGLNSLFGK
jgi:hypothetical protein